MTTARYQGGSIALKKRSKGSDVWEFRWRDATGTQLSKLLGSVERYPTKRDAQCAADAFRLEVNAELPKAVPITVATLVDRYLQDKIEMDRLAFSTKKSYSTHLGHWVKPRWGKQRLEQVRTMAVEQWLRDLLLAPRTKVHLRNTLHVLFECAVRWELIRDNPITRVRQGGSRLVEPDVLTPDEFHSLLKELEDDRQDRAGHAFTGNFTLDVYGGKPAWAGNVEAARKAGLEIEQAVKAAKDARFDGLTTGRAQISPSPRIAATA